MLEFKITAKVLEESTLRMLKFLNNITCIYLKYYSEYMSIGNKCFSICFRNYLMINSAEGTCGTRFTNQIIIFITNSSYSSFNLSK